MIDLEKKGKKATGLKKPGDWIYKPDKDFWISRTKYNNFKDCPRCFYLDVVKGFKEPKPPGWALNSRTDGLLKKEFDLCRHGPRNSPSVRYTCFFIDGVDQITS